MVPDGIMTAGPGCATPPGTGLIAWTNADNAVARSTRRPASAAGAHLLDVVRAGLLAALMMAAMGAAAALSAPIRASSIFEYLD
jgi:hypothetical protein